MMAVSMGRGAVTVSVELEGWEELERKLKRIGGEVNVQRVIEDALAEGGEHLKAALQAGAPYRTGQLRGSIVISRNGREKYSIRVGPDGDGFYGRFLEYGTRKMRPHPWMRPTFDRVAHEVEQAISDALWRKVLEASRA